MFDRDGTLTIFKMQQRKIDILQVGEKKQIINFRESKILSTIFPLPNKFKS